MWDAIVQLCCCAFYKAFLTDPIGSSQERTLRATIAILGSDSSRQLLFQRRCYNKSGTFWKFYYVSGPSCNFLEEDVATYQEHLESYVKKMLLRIRNVLEVTWRRGCNVSEMSCKLLDEDVTTYQERLAGYMEKRLQRIRNVLQVTWRRCCYVSGTSYRLLEEDATTYQERLASYLTKMLQRIRTVLQVTWRRCYNVAGNRYWQRRPQDAITLL